MYVSKKKFEFFGAKIKFFLLVEFDLTTKNRNFNKIAESQTDFKINKLLDGEKLQLVKCSVIGCALIFVSPFH